MTAKLAKFISWTGWTKEDWVAFLYILTPMNLMSKTGWTKEQWVEASKDAAKFLGSCAFVLLILNVFAYFDLIL